MISAKQHPPSQDSLPLLFDCRRCGLPFNSAESLNLVVCDDCTDEIDWDELFRLTENHDVKA